MRTIRDRILMAIGGAMAVAAVATAVVLSTLAGPAAAAQPELTECQHPTVTGVEVFRLHGVSAPVACDFALNLFLYEAYEHGHIYRCIKTFHPVLTRRRFDGWTMSITNGFVASRGDASFSVTGTDFPINCT